MKIIRKNTCVARLEATQEELQLVNEQSIKTLSAEDVFVFRMVACDSRVDREHERFDVESLHKLAALYIGKPVILDHHWSAKTQTARVYGSAVEFEDGTHRLVLRAYMLRQGNGEQIAAIEGGILREVSVGCAARKRTCSICGKAMGQCEHRGGKEYHGETCHAILSDIVDAYEVSFVAVPAQPGAGITKSLEDTDEPDELDEPEEAQAEQQKTFYSRRLRLMKQKILANENELEE